MFDNDTISLKRKAGHRGTKVSLESNSFQAFQCQLRICCRRLYPVHTIFCFTRTLQITSGSRSATNVWDHSTCEDLSALCHLIAEKWTIERMLNMRYNKSEWFRVLCVCFYSHCSSTYMTQYPPTISGCSAGECSWDKAAWCVFRSDGAPGKQPSREPYLFKIPNMCHPLWMHSWCYWQSEWSSCHSKMLATPGNQVWDYHNWHWPAPWQLSECVCTLRKLAASNCRFGAKVPTWSPCDTKQGVLPDCPQELDGEEFGPLIVCQGYVWESSVTTDDNMVLSSNSNVVHVVGPKLNACLSFYS